MSIPILMYHNIAYPKDSKLKNLFVTPKQFAMHMKLLNSLGYQGLSLKQLTPYLKGEKIGKVVGISFDDGYQNNLINAAPILKHYNFGATCYLVSNKLGEYNDWDSQYGIESLPLMTKVEVKKWLDMGLDIGSHTAHHTDLTQCSQSQLQNEITQSKYWLEELFQYQVTDFCYPYGFYKQEVVNMVKQSGFITATTTEKRKVNTQDNLLLLPRINMTLKTGIIGFLWKTIYQK